MRNGLTTDPYGVSTFKGVVSSIFAFLTLRGTGSGAATGYMFGVVAFFSLIPIVVALGDGGSSPFLFNSAWRMGLILGVSVFGLLYMGIFHRPLLAYYWQHRNIVARHIPNILLLISVINGFDYALLALSVRFVDVSVAAVLFEMWPIFFVLLRANLEKQHLSLTTFMLLFPAVAGLAFVIFSQSEAGNVIEGVSKDVLLGGVLAFLGGLASACTAFSFKWALDLQNKLPTPPQEEERSAPVALALVPVLIAFLLTNLVAFPLTIIIGVSSGESIAINSAGLAFLAVGLLGGALVQALGSMLYRVSNVVSDSLGVNAIYYFTPCFTLLWLSIIGAVALAISGWTPIISGIDVAHVDLLIIGTVLIISSNLLVNFEAEIRWSFKSIVLALGVCGAIVYLRESIFDLLNVPNWAWSGDGYFGSVSLAATVFTLLLAFRVARLVTRTNDEENRTFALLRKLDGLVRRDVIDGEVRECIRVIDESNKQIVLKEYYLETRRFIGNATPNNEGDRQILSEVEAELDSLVRSKQTSPVLGEIFALIIFAAITIFLAMFTRPTEPDGWIRVLLDLFAMLVSSVIVFLMIYSMDLDRERDAHKLERTKVGGEYLLLFPDTEQRLFDQWLSIAVGVAIVLTYAGLMAHKWLGWFGGNPPVA